MVKHITTGKRGRTFKRHITTDAESGEVTDILLIGNPEQFDKDFVKVFHAFTEELLENEEIAGKAIRLLFWIMKVLDYGQIEFYLYNKDVAEELNVSVRTITEWKKTLIKNGIIKKIKPNLYQLNPACVVKGKGHRLIDEFRQPSLFDDV